MDKYTVTLSPETLTQLYRGMMESADKYLSIARERKSQGCDYAFWLGVGADRKQAIRTCLQSAINAGFVANDDIITELKLTRKSM